ncbi:transporter, partial [bacterium]|nr:transporter [bacterium]
MASSSLTRRAAASLLALLSALSLAPAAQAAGLHTDVAMTPDDDGTIVRVQWRHNNIDGKVTTVQPITVIHGLSQNFAILGTVPLIHRGSKTGIGDVTFLAKYRFYQNDGPGKTTRWAVLGGLELPSRDKEFSSDSFDPIIGTVWTHSERNWWVDWDVVYKLNTAGGMAGDDVLRVDAAYSRLIRSGERGKNDPWGLYLVGEVNSKYISDSSKQVFFSPGIQYFTSRWILEAGVQLPVYQDMQAPRPETDYTFVVSFRKHL